MSQILVEKSNSLHIRTVGYQRRQLIGNLVYGNTLHIFLEKRCSENESKEEVIELNLEHRISVINL